MENNEFWSKNQKIFQESANRYTDLTNTIFFDLIKQLIVVATSIFAASMVLVNIESISTLLSDLDKSLIIIVWVLNGLSILFGIIQLYLDHLFFRKYSRILETVTGKISRREFQTELEMNEYIKEIHKPLKKNSNTNWMFLQAFTILSSLIILIFIAGGLLYK